MHQPAASETPSPEEELETLCAALLYLSQQVAGALQQGAGAPVLVPLLRQELDLARRLQEGIFSSARQPGGARTGERRQRLASDLRALLDLEQDNHRLLSRRGIRLRGPRALAARPVPCP